MSADQVKGRDYSVDRSSGGVAFLLQIRWRGVAFGITYICTCTSVAWRAHRSVKLAMRAHNCLHVRHQAIVAAVGL